MNENQFKWDLLSVASYVNIQLEKYIQEKSLDDAICKVHLVSSNLNQVKKMGGFLKDLLQEKNKKNFLAIDEILEKYRKGLSP